MDATDCLIAAEVALTHQAFDLDIFGSICDPDAVTGIAQLALDQLNRFDHHHPLICPLDQDPDCLLNERVDDIFQVLIRLPDRETLIRPVWNG